jgi:hypothetical protein
MAASREEARPKASIGLEGPHPKTPILAIHPRALRGAFWLFHVKPLLSLHIMHGHLDNVRYAANLQKHHVALGKAVTIFSDRLNITIKAGSGMVPLFYF